MKRSKNKYYRKKDSNSLKFFVVFLSIVIAIICTVNTFCIMCLSCPSIINEIFGLELNMYVGPHAIDSTLLSTGLSIIGIVISIWAGLHIIQVLGKNKYEILEHEVLQYADERKNISYYTLLKNINSLNDEFNKYLYYKLSSINLENVSSELLFILCQVEIGFQNIYAKHYGDMTIDIKYGTNIIEDLDKCQDYLVETPSKTKDVLEEYINSRKAEIYFYLGYINYIYFPKALDLYVKVFPDFENPSPKVLLSFDTEDIPFLTYLLNTLGETCSRVVFEYNNRKHLSEYEKSELEKYINLTRRYYEILMDLLESHPCDEHIHRDVYFRNYGCALERIYKKTLPFDKETFNNIRNAYQKAIDLAKNDISDKDFKVWLSLFKKYSDQYFYSSSDKKSYKLTTNLNDDDYKYIYEYSLQAEVYGVLAVNKCDDKILYIKYLLYAYRNMCWLNKITNNETEYKRYIKLYEEWLHVIIKLNVNEEYEDTFYKELTEQFKLFNAQ